MCGLLDTSAETRRHRAPFTLQKLSLEDNPLLLRGLAEVYLSGVPRRAVIVVYVNHAHVGEVFPGRLQLRIFPSAAVDPVAVKSVQAPGQRKHD